MQVDESKHIHNCKWCLRFMAKPMRMELQPIKATYPLELVHMDYLTIESGKGDKDVNILIISDHFTRYAQVKCMNSQTAKAMAQALGDKLIIHCVLPECNISDQGRNLKVISCRLIM